MRPFTQAVDRWPRLQSCTQNIESQIQVPTARCQRSLHGDRSAFPTVQVRQKEEEEVWEDNKWKRGQVIRTQKLGATGLLNSVVGAKHFTNIPSILSKSYEETKYQRICEVASNQIELLRTGTSDLNSTSLQKLPTALYDLERILPSEVKDVYRSSPYVMQTRCA